MAKLEDIHALTQGNVYESMLRDLADSLGVDAEALKRLEIGWLPIVRFKKRTNYQGWWVIPERDADGGVVGLSLRSRSGAKVMHPGSKHGLTYAINPQHERGGVAYKRGAHNWVRTMDAGVECPICGKPDGCLLSAEDPDDPQAVVCIRKQKGSDKPLKWGWLHIRKPEGRPNVHARPLADSDQPVIVVEGMTDTAAALGLGFEAVGRPSNLAGMELLKTLLRGRRAIVVGENDDVNSSTGTRPGEEGMLATFQVLRNVCKDVRKVLPPDTVKDLRQWVNTYDLTAEQFLAYVDQRGDSKADTTVIEDDRDLSVAKAYLMDSHRMAGRYTLRFFNGLWFRYRDGKYVHVDELDVGQPLYQWAHHRFVQVEQPSGEKKLERLKATRHWVGNVTAAMAAETRIETPTAPCWINGAEGPNPKDLISFANGIMHVPSYLAGADFSQYMLDPTPDLFTLASLPFPFDPTAKCPTFRRWTRSSLGDEFAKIRLLQEFAGYCMTCDTSRHKMLWLRGVPSAGKSLFVNVLRQLVGEEQYAVLRFQQLSERFGLEHLVGKLIASMADLRTPRNVDMATALQSVLNLTGDDAVPIERKFEKTEANHRLQCRIVVSSNEMPQFADPTGALKRRILLVEFKRGFVGKEDRGLEQKFSDEIPGIAVWALEGLRRLRESEHGFTIPESMQTVMDEWHRDNTPVSTFIEECVEFDQEEWVEKKDVYRAFQQWCEEHGHHPCRFTNFKQRWADRVPSDVRPETVSHKGRKYSVWLGARLTNWAEKAYLGKPKNL